MASSGIVANASVKPLSSISRAGWPRRTPRSGTRTHAVTATISAARASSAIAFCSGVGGSFRLRDEPPESPDLGVVAERDDNALAGARRHQPQCRRHHRRALGERRAGGHRLRSLRRRQGLAGEPGLVRGEAVGRHDADVGGDERARLDEQDIADHEVADRDRLRDTRPPHERVGSAELPRSARGAFWRAPRRPPRRPR